MQKEVKMWLPHTTAVCKYNFLESWAPTLDLVEGMERIITLGKAEWLNRCSREYAESKRARDAYCQSTSQLERREWASEHFQSLGRWMEGEGKSRIREGRNFTQPCCWACFLCQWPRKLIKLDWDSEGCNPNSSFIVCSCPGWHIYPSLLRYSELLCFTIMRRASQLHDPNVLKWNMVHYINLVQTISFKHLNLISWC